MRPLADSLRTCAHGLGAMAAMATVLVPTHSFAHGNSHHHKPSHHKPSHHGHGHHGPSQPTNHKDDYYPSPTNRYMDKRVTVCDQGSFFVGGALKPTHYPNSSTRASVPDVLMIGQMYVSFQIPESYKDWPVIFVSGGAHTGAALESTPDGREGWAHHALRKGIPSFNVDQSGRGRSGFDASAIHEGVALLTDGDPSNDAEGKSLIPNFLTLGLNTWRFWFGHLVDPSTGQPTNGSTSDPYVDQLVPHSWDASLDPDSAAVHDPGVTTQFPLNWWSEEVIPDNLVPKGEQLSKDFAGPMEAYKLNYYRQLVPNSEQTLPYGLCPTCDPEEIAGGGGFASGHTWTSRNVAELVEILGRNYGGAVIATHSQSGPIGHHAMRTLKQHGTLGYLKGLITVEGTSVTLAGAGLEAADFDKVPYLVVKGDFSGTSGASQGIVDELIARRQSGHGRAAVEYIKLDEAPSTANAWPRPLHRPIMPGITHMMMLSTDEGYGYDSNDIMDMILKWSDKNIRKMHKNVSCNDRSSGSRWHR
jgi:hypothetical protein